MLFGKPSRRTWWVAIIASVLCVSGLAYALITDWDAPADRSLEPNQRRAAGRSGFGLGLGVGVGACVVVASLVALRRKS